MLHTGECENLAGIAKGDRRGRAGGYDRPLRRRTAIDKGDVPGPACGHAVISLTQDEQAMPLVRRMNPIVDLAFAKSLLQKKNFVLPRHNAFSFVFARSA